MSDNIKKTASDVNMAAPRYLDATNDVAFKKVFSNKEILIDFLNSMLHLTEGNKITELHFVPQEEIPDLGQGKRSIFDIKVLDLSGFWYIIEMQNRPDEFFLKRVQVYASSTYWGLVEEPTFLRHVVNILNSEQYVSNFKVTIEGGFRNI